MNLEQLRENYLPLLKTHKLPFAMTSIGLILIVVGIGSTVFSENETKGVIIEEAASTESATLSRHIVVDVAGAVAHPGVYKLGSDARIQEALIAAGGLSGKADRDYISKSINLAQKLSDGAKIYIPSKGEAERTGLSLININTASVSELDTLSGVGQVLAQKIIDNRPYTKIEDLVSKKILGDKIFEKIKGKISVY